MRAFITGATGFLGRHIVRALMKTDAFVVRLVRDDIPVPGAERIDSIAQPDEEIRIVVDVHGDLSDLALLERVLAEYEIDTVIHLASQTQVSTAVADPIGTFESNVRGTWNVLEACHRQKVKRVIVASSDKAFGDGPVPYCIDEPLRPHGIYATSKACADMLAQSYIREFGMSIAITRCGNLFGPGHVNFSTLIPGTIKSIIEGKRPILRSDGKHVRDFLFVEDAVAGYLALTKSDKIGPYNFGSYYAHGRLPTTLAVMREILEAMDSDLEPDIQDTAKNEIKDQFLDCSETEHAIGWTPKHTLKQGLAKTIPWYKDFLKETA